MNNQIEENYLKEIFKLLSGEDLSVSTSALATALNLQAASVTDMIKKLSAKGLINYKKYQGVTLTDKGRMRAVKVVRKHRLWEVFLVEKLNFNWGEVHAIAEQLEHIQSDELADRLEEFLNNPKTDPHGDPIPDKEGKLEVNNNLLLSQLKAGDHATVVGVRDDKPQLLNYLDSIGLILNKEIEVQDVLEFDSSMTLSLMGEKLSISSKIASNLYVEKV